MYKRQAIHTHSRLASGPHTGCSMTTERPLATPKHGSRHRSMTTERPLATPKHGSRHLTWSLRSQPGQSTQARRQTHRHPLRDLTLSALPLSRSLNSSSDASAQVGNAVLRAERRGAPTPAAAGANPRRAPPSVDGRSSTDLLRRGTVCARGTGSKRRSLAAATRPATVCTAPERRERVGVTSSTPSRVGERRAGDARWGGRGHACLLYTSPSPRD